MAARKSSKTAEEEPKSNEEKVGEKETGGFTEPSPVEVPKGAEERMSAEEKVTVWNPKTSLGKKVMAGEIKNIEEILFSGWKIVEPGIVDHLVPNIQSELVLIGGRTGKGGGIQRIPVRITAKMHGSGRRFRTSSLIVVGNSNGLVGVGRASSTDARTAMEKSLKKAKLSIIKVKRGCGDWECGCGTEHSISYKTKGKSGSVRVELLPAPKGIGLVASMESKKILRLAGIKDIWTKTFGNTSDRINLIYAIFDALKKLYVYEGR